MNMTPLSDEELQELRELKAAYAAARDAKFAWLDRKRVEHSTLKVGDEAFDLRTGERLGVITEIRDHNYNPDDSSIEGYYVFDTGDNSSRVYRVCGTRAQLVERMRRDAERLEKEDLNADR